MGGNTGTCMGGWFRNEIAGTDSLKGLKVRALGLGGEVYRRLGATPLTTSPGEIVTSLQSGLIDGAEFVGPGSDIALGLYRVASFYYAPGFNKPNGTGECLINKALWEDLDAQTRAIVAHACAAEAAYALNEMERLNVEALAALTGTHGVKLRAFPTPIVAAAREHARAVLGEIGARNDIARRVTESYTLFRERAGAWANLSLKAVLESRTAG
jgi:TRAP-type mannitol/chloroaromatic compound transport system substrate-binding protein